MGNRGRTSAAAASLSVITGGALQTIARPVPPDDLTDEEADIWRTVVNRLPADWFPAETLPLLTQYCRHTVSAGVIVKLVRELEAAVTKSIADGTEKTSAILGSAKMLDRLLKMQERESRCIASLATKMRLSQQTTYDKTRKKGSNGPAKPWE